MYKGWTLVEDQGLIKTLDEIASTFNIGRVALLVRRVVFDIECPMNNDYSITDVGPNKILYERLRDIDGTVTWWRVE